MAPHRQQTGTMSSMSTNFNPPALGKPLQTNASQPLQPVSMKPAQPFSQPIQSQNTGWAFNSNSSIVPTGSNQSTEWSFSDPQQSSGSHSGWSFGGDSAARGSPNWEGSSMTNDSTSSMHRKSGAISPGWDNMAMINRKGNIAPHTQYQTHNRSGSGTGLLGHQRNDSGSGLLGSPSHGHKSPLSQNDIDSLLSWVTAFHSTTKNIILYLMGLSVARHQVASVILFIAVLYFWFWTWFYVKWWSKIL